MAEVHEPVKVEEDLIQVEDEQPLEGAIDQPMDQAESSTSERRPSVSEPQPKRQRRNELEDKKRGQRLFGNLLGTLAKFKGEEKSRGSTEAAKRRDEISNRVAAKLQSETQLRNEIQTLEREVKDCRMGIERKEFELRNKQISVRTRSTQLPRTAHFLLTSSVWNTPTPSLPPSGFGPARDKTIAETPKPLYYRPKKLLPEQEEFLTSQTTRITALVAQETSDLAALELSTEEDIAALRVRLANAVEALEVKRPRQERRPEVVGRDRDVSMNGNGNGVEEKKEKVEEVQKKELVVEEEEQDDMEIDDDEVVY